MKLSCCSSCSVQLSRKPKLSVNLWQKPELILNLLWKPELSTYSCRENHYSAWSSCESLYIYSFWFMKKIIRPEGPAKKITLLRYCPKKIFRPRPKSQAPPEYQMDRA